MLFALLVRGLCTETVFQLFIQQIKQPGSRSGCPHAPTEVLSAELSSWTEAGRLVGTDVCKQQSPAGGKQGEPLFALSCLCRNPMDVSGQHLFRRHSPSACCTSQQLSPHLAATAYLSLTPLTSRKTEGMENKALRVN